MQSDAGLISVGRAELCMDGLQITSVVNQLFGKGTLTSMPWGKWATDGINKGGMERPA